MMIGPNSRGRKGEKERGKVKGECGRIWGEEEEGNADYGGMVQPSQEHVAPCVKRIEWRLIVLERFETGASVLGRYPGSRGYTGGWRIVPRRRRTAIRIPLQSPHTTRRKTVAVYSTPTQLTLRTLWQNNYLSRNVSREQTKKYLFI